MKTTEYPNSAGALTLFSECARRGAQQCSRGARDRDVSGGGTSHALLRPGTAALRQRWWVMLLVTALVHTGARARAQGVNSAAAINHVLELDGTNSYVELPPNIFSNLTQATI